MKKILFTALILSIILGMSNCKEDTEETRNEKNVTIVFNIDGGNNIPSVTVSYDTTLAKIEAEKEGYSFKGWFLDAEFNTPFDFNKPLKDQFDYQDSVTLYAKFLQKLYRVTYDGNGNTKGNVPVDNKLYAEGDQFKPIWGFADETGGGLYRGLYSFQGWLVEGASTESRFAYDNPQENIYFADYYSVIIVGESDINFIAVYDLKTLQ